MKSPWHIMKATCSCRKGVTRPAFEISPCNLALCLKDGKTSRACVSRPWPGPRWRDLRQIDLPQSPPHRRAKVLCLSRQHAPHFPPSTILGLRPFLHPTSPHLHLRRLFPSNQPLLPLMPSSLHYPSACSSPQRDDEIKPSCVRCLSGHRHDSANLSPR